MTTSLSRSGILAALLVALLAAACGSADPSAPPSASATATAVPSVPASPDASDAPSPSASPAAAACDEDAPAASGDPSPAAEDPDAALYEQIESEVTALRGITATTPVARGVFTKAALCAYLAKQFREDNPESLITGTDTLYKHLLLLSTDASLEDLYLELLSSQVAGLYNDTTKQMYVVADDGEIGPEEKIAYAHEYTHALQDQRFVLKDLVGDATDQGDRTFARTTLVEGDATLLMSLWAQQQLTPGELGGIGSSADPDAQAVLDRMPAILRDSLLFPYTGGLQLALAAFRDGGFAGVDALYANPPDTMEQVLHPEKLAAREAPIAVAFPAGFAANLGEGWKVALEDTLGEFQLQILVDDAAGGSDSSDAAQGWGGDRVALVEGPEGASAAILDTAWDTEGDAVEFAGSLAGYVARMEAAGFAGAVLTPSPDRVVVISATDADTLGLMANVLGLAD